MTEKVTISIKTNQNLVIVKTDKGLTITTQEEAEEMLIEKARPFAIAELLTRHDEEFEGIFEEEHKKVCKQRIVPWNEQGGIGQ